MKTIAIATSLIIFGLLEWRWPFFRPARPRWASLAVNLELAVINAIAVRCSTALLLQHLLTAARPLGLLGPNPGPAALAIALLLLDLYAYFWHRLMHHSRWGWRLHCVHHSDRQLNITSTYRFHTLEVLLSQLPKIALICLLGIPPTALLVYESLYAAGLLFHHSNWALPQPWDRWLSWLIVTPHYHRQHHSEQPAEQNSNYASGLTLWDAVFGSRCYPRRPDRLRLGLASPLPGLASRSLNPHPHLRTLLRLPFADL